MSQGPHVQYEPNSNQSDMLLQEKRKMLVNANIHTKNVRRAGFTLVELMLAMAFVSGLLLAIALLTIQVVNTYTKGVTLSAVDQAAQIVIREISDQLGSSLRSDVKIIDQPNGGRLCTGKLSYVWNYGDAINDRSGTLTVNAYNNSNKDLRFVKVEDPGAKLCISNNLSPNIDDTRATELLAGQDRNVALRSLTFSPYSLAESAQTIYTVSATIATNNQGELITGQTACKPPIEGYNEFCAVNRFEFTVRSGNTDTGGS